MRDDEESVSMEGVSCTKETEKALLCKVNGSEQWVPKSQICEDSEVNEEGDEGTLVVTAWIANQKGWV